MGKIAELAADRFKWLKRGETPTPISTEIIERFKKLGDLSSTVSDVLDGMGIAGAVGASDLKPTLLDQPIVGTAVTVRNAALAGSSYANALKQEWHMAEVLTIAAAGPGDVLLIEGVPHVSNMGGLMATIAKHQGLAGAIVDGAVRDVGQSRALGFPVWSTDISPVTGKWRIITRELNGPITLAGVSVLPGDLVIADETGVCFIPRDKVEEVLQKCENIASLEDRVINNLQGGSTVEEFIEGVYGREAL
jgi:regulator of RNase E activity RraA